MTAFGAAYQLTLLTFVIILLRNIVAAEMKETVTLSDISSTVTTKPFSNALVSSVVDEEKLPKSQIMAIRNTFQLYTDIRKAISKSATKELYSIKVSKASHEERGAVKSDAPSNVPLITSSVKLVQPSSQMGVASNSVVKGLFSEDGRASRTTNKQESSAIPDVEERRLKNATATVIPDYPMLSTAVEASSKAEHLVAVSKATMQMESSKPEQSLVTSTIYGKSKLLKNEIKTITSSSFPQESKFTVEMTSVKLNKTSLVSKTLEPTHPAKTERKIILNVTASITQPKTETVQATSVVNKESTSIILERASNHSLKIGQSVRQSTTSSKSPRVPGNLTTAVPSVQVEQLKRTVFLQPSPSPMTKLDASTTPVVNVTKMLYRKSMSEGGVYLTSNRSSVQPSKSDEVVLTSNRTATITAIKRRISGQSIPMIKNESRTAELHVTVYTTIQPKLSRVEIITKSATSVKLGSTMSTLVSTSTPRTSSTEMELSTHIDPIRTMTGNRIAVSMTMAKKTLLSYTQSSGSTSSIKKVIVRSYLTETIKPSSTESFVYSTPEHKTLSKTKKQQFRITFKITSEAYSSEYVSGTRAFRKKSREIEDVFDEVFKNKPEYLYTEVLKFFSGSLGCEVLIHTKSKDSDPVSTDEITETLNTAKKTKTGFGEFEVGDIDVKEESPEVQGSNENDDKETWGRLPVIVISILGGVCLVLLVLVISQCIQKRHYSHSLAESNEIREFSPAIHLKNDDNMYKDDESVPMTTFNQTDIY